MKPCSLAIVGSAGRNADAPRMTQDLYSSMLRKALLVIDRLAGNHDLHVDQLVSGGAAFADHVAITLFLGNHVSRLSLNLPCRFDSNVNRFFDDRSGNTAKTAKTINYYHARFTEVLGRKSLDELGLAIEKAKEVSVYSSFLARNSAVAAQADALLAMTFGNGPEVKPGGTADTVRKFLARPDHGPIFHMDLGTGLCYNTAKVAK